MSIVKRAAALGVAAAIALALSGCMKDDGGPVTWRLADAAAPPALPEGLERNGEGVPVLKVYDAAKGELVDTDAETYVAGVVAGEMKNDWPMEALKAQAVLARTFVMKFCADKKSKYDGADISTDVSEAQAYAPESVNARVEQAVSATRGQVLVYQGDFINAWFHAHSGGMTELPSVALDYRGGDPAYLTPTASEESDKAPESARRWTATFTTDQVRAACADAGVKVGKVESVALGERGASGRAKALVVNGESVSAPSFRIRIGANRLRSTLMDSVQLKDGRVTFTGRGFGHGVGLSQWGAYRLAEEGRRAGEILMKYFTGVELAQLW